MKLFDVKIDASTSYFCLKNKKECSIVSTFVSDGATLVACDMSDDNFLDLWVTEACYLIPIESQPIKEFMELRARGEELITAIKELNVSEDV